MARVLTLLLAGAVLVIPQVCGGDVPLPPPTRGGGPVPQSEAGLPVGKWKVEFANGVSEVGRIRKDGTASVVEPRRTSAGKTTVQGGSAVITFEDDRIERWTAVGKRFVVEHWFPGSQFPNGTSVLGIAERAKRQKRSNR
jgi:hypothetical protein